VLPNVLTHEGKLVGFCCDKCPVAFKKEPAKYAANIKFDLPAPAAVEKKVEEKRPAEVKTAEKKAADVKPADVKPADTKPAEKKVEGAPAAAPAAAVTAVSVVNTKCPVSDHAVEAGFTAVVDGRTVGFCCDKCMAKFNKDPKKFAEKIVADAKTTK